MLLHFLAAHQVSLVQRIKKQTGGNSQFECQLFTVLLPCLVSPCLLEKTSRVTNQLTCPILPFYLKQT